MVLVEFEWRERGIRTRLLRRISQSSFYRTHSIAGHVDRASDSAVAPPFLKEYKDRDSLFKRDEFGGSKERAEGGEKIVRRSCVSHEACEPRPHFILQRSLDAIFIHSHHIVFSIPRGWCNRLHHPRVLISCWDVFIFVIGVIVNSMNKKIILFDFDGVIADSYHAAFDVNKMIYPNLTEEEYQKRFSGNINDAVAKADATEKRTGVDFFEEYIPRLLESPIVPGMREVIESLVKKYTLIIVSSTITSPISEYLDKHGIASFFTDVMGNDVEASKVKKIHLVFEKYGVSAEDCVFITDTLGDLHEAAEAGVRSIAVTWGYQPKEILARGNPPGLVEQPEGLEEKVRDCFDMAKR